jgi:hypothetical protein
MRFGSTGEANKILQGIGCSLETIAKYQERYDPLFPCELFNIIYRHHSVTEIGLGIQVPFEIIGMLGSSYHLPGSAFRRIPNPTTVNFYHSFDSIFQLFTLFHTCLLECMANEASSRLMKIRCQSIADHCTDFISMRDTNSHSNPAIETLDKIHEARASYEELLSRIPVGVVESIMGYHITAIVNALHDPDSALNKLDLAIEGKDAFKMLMTFYFHSIRPAGVAGKFGKVTSSSELEEIWITLMFGMLCWLLLHAIDMEDVQLIPSNPHNSRVPVYIG